MSFPARDLVTSLRSNLCPACGGKKKPRNTLCGGCYFILAPSQRAALYHRVGEGYEEAFADAMKHLKIEQPQFARPS